MIRWFKHGKIFDPSEHQLPNGCQKFAQSPQALVLPDRVRIYFSTRAVDPSNGKFLSHIAFVDMDKRLKNILGISKDTVLPLGGLGCFDEHGIFPINVLPVGDKVYGYTCGWSRRVSVSVDTGIGLTISHDGGSTFERVGTGPIMAASLHQPFLVGDAFVKLIGGEFHMWYIFGKAWKQLSPDSPPDRVYKINHAISDDGINWTADSVGDCLIADKLGEDECQALPTVIEIDGRFHMFFCFREAFNFRTDPKRGYRIGHAHSVDLKSWIRDDESHVLPVKPGEWDSDMQCYPHVFECEGRIYLLYNGNAFGREGFGLAELQK